MAQETLEWAGGPVRELLEPLAERHPDLRPLLPHLRVAVNQEFAGPGRAEVPAGAELALIPPVAGGCGPVPVVDRPLRLEEVVAAVSGEAYGGLVTFSGSVRNQTQGRRVLRLEYEAYPPMAEKRAGGHWRRGGARWPGRGWPSCTGWGRWCRASWRWSLPRRRRTGRRRSWAVEHAIERLKQDVPILEEGVLRGRRGVGGPGALRPGRAQRLPASGGGGLRGRSRRQRPESSRPAAGAAADRGAGRARLRRQRLAARAQLVLVLLEALGEHPLGVGHRGAELGDVVLALAAGGAQLGHPRPAADGQLALVVPEQRRASSGLHLAQDLDVLLAGRVGLHGDEGWGGRRGGEVRRGRSGGRGRGLGGPERAPRGRSLRAGAPASRRRGGGRRPGGLGAWRGRRCVWAMASAPANPAARNRARRTFMGPLFARGGPGPYPLRGGTVGRHPTKVPWSRTETRNELLPRDASPRSAGSRRAEPV